MAERNIVIVLMDVEYDGSKQEWNEQDAMQQLFAFAGETTLRAGSTTVYQSGNYDFDETSGCWVGELSMIRHANTVSVRLDRTRGHRIVRNRATESVQEYRSVYAYHPKKHTFSMWERAEIPYTRMQSYVNKVARPQGVRLRLTPRAEERTAWQMLDLFDSVRTIGISYRHSQSPGNAVIDGLLETVNAHSAGEQIRAASGEHLDLDALRKNPKLPPHQAIEHVSVNPQNGEVVATGTVGDEDVTYRSRDQVRRLRATADPESQMMATLIASIARKG